MFKMKTVDRKNPKLIGRPSAQHKRNQTSRYALEKSKIEDQKKTRDGEKGKVEELKNQNAYSQWHFHAGSLSIFSKDVPWRMNLDVIGLLILVMLFRQAKFP